MVINLKVDSEMHETKWKYGPNYFESYEDFTFDDDPIEHAYEPLSESG